MEIKTNIATVKSEKEDYAAFGWVITSLKIILENMDNNELTSYKADGRTFSYTYIQYLINIMESLKKGGTLE